MLAAARFTINSIATLGFIGAPTLDGMYTLSPFVWRDGIAFAMLLRLVNRSEDASKKVSRVHAATSADGIVFTIDDLPTLAPTAGSPDADGCEDPTIVAHDDALAVFYSGWSAATQTSTMLLADGPTPPSLEKRGEVIAGDAEHANLKEATVVGCDDGTWAMFFEHATGGSSLVGLARAPSLRGPWRIARDFSFPQRPGSWDAWHLSPGPIVGEGSDRPTMFYNGGNEDGAWRIGWVTFDRSYSRIVDRCDEPVIVPPLRVGDESDIAFASSAVEIDDSIALYYSIADKTPKRALLVRD